MALRAAVRTLVSRITLWAHKRIRDDKLNSWLREELNRIADRQAWIEEHHELYFSFGEWVKVDDLEREYQELRGRRQALIEVKRRLEGSQDD